MNRRRNNRVRGRRRRRPGPARVVMSRRDPSFPPQNKAKPLCSRTFRYYATGAVANAPITRRCLLNLVLAGTNGSTTAVNVYEAVKLEFIALYFAPSSADGLGNSASELLLTWTGDRGPDTRFSDRGTISHPACIKERPPVDSLAGFWSTIFSDMDEPLLYISTPANTVIDIHVSMCIGDGAGKTCVIVDPTISGIVYTALDNAIVAGTVGVELCRPDSLTYANMTTP